jgi:hypothetical protein
LTAWQKPPAEELEMLPKEIDDTSELGHYEQDGIKIKRISVKIDNNTPESTSQTKKSKWGHAINQYYGL